MPVTKERKQELYKEFGGNASNTGSIEAQVAVLTERINFLSEHLKSNKKDHSTRLSLIKMVGRRKRFLRYLADKDIELYRTLIKQLGLRK